MTDSSPLGATRKQRQPRPPQRKLVVVSGRHRGKRIPGGLAAAALCLIALAAPTPGCSFLFVDGPPAGHERLPYFDCSTSVAWPVVDTIFSGLFVSTLIEATSRSDAYYSTSTYSRQEDITYSAIFLGLYGASALVGYARSSDCRAAKAEAARRPAPVPSYPPPPYGYPYAPPGYPPAYALPPGYAPPPGSAPRPSDPWAPPPRSAPPAPTPPAPGPAPGPPATSPAAPPPPGTSASRHLAPRLHLDLLAFAGRLGTLPSSALLAHAPLRLLATTW
jgi:hypothetical protein